MLEFPKLKTQAEVQYPVQMELEAATAVFTFLDGKQQRFPQLRPRRRWIILLDQLDENEAARLAEFARRHRETAEPFRFTDPLTGAQHYPCYLDGGEHEQSALGPGRRRTSLVVVEGGA